MIKLVGFPKVSSQQAEERQFSASYVKVGVAKGFKSTLQWGGEGGGREIHLTFLTFATSKKAWQKHLNRPFSSKFSKQTMLQMLGNIITFNSNKFSQPAHRNTYNFSSQQDSSGQQISEEQIRWVPLSLPRMLDCDDVTKFVLKAPRQLLRSPYL